VTGDGRVSASDALAIVNHLNRQASLAAQWAGGAEGESDEFFSDLDSTDSREREEVLALLADDLASRRTRRRF
jgi:hypothetical protein